MTVPFWNNFRPKKEKNTVFQYQSQTRTIMLSHTHYGPTVTVVGRIEAVTGIIKVKEISLSINNVAQTGFHPFQWLAVLPLDYAPKNLRHADLQPANKFMVHPEQPHEYNILFHDRDAYAEMKNVFKEIRERWQEQHQRRSALKKSEILRDFENFMTQPDIVKAHSMLQDSFYWNAGEYFMMTQILTQDDRVFEAQKSFMISTDEQQWLRENTRLIIAELCGLPGNAYRFLTQKLEAHNTDLL